MLSVQLLFILSPRFLFSSFQNITAGMSLDYCSSQFVAISHFVFSPLYVYLLSAAVVCPQSHYC